jgi:hypothetical protein
MSRQTTSLAFLIGFTLVSTRDYFSYFSVLAGYGAVVLGILICAYCFIFSLSEFEMDGPAISVALGATLFLVLSWILQVIGEPAPDVRTVWIGTIQQWLLVMCLLHFRQFTHIRKYLAYIIFSLLLLQLCLSLLQYTHYSYGIGLPIRADEYQERFFVTGPYYNANDNSLYATSFLIALIALHNSTKRTLLIPISVAVTGIIAWLSLSRSMLVISSIISILALVSHRSHSFGARSIRIPYISVFAVIIVITAIALTATSIYSDDSDVGKRSAQRAESLAFLGQDESIQARIQSYVRLVGLISNPWGTLTDLQYGEYFKSSDDIAIQENPHSFIVESAFLYGLAGLLAAALMLCGISIGIMNNSGLAFPMRLAVIGALFIGQSVPGSILAVPYFFAPFVMAMRISRGARGPEYP